MTEKDNIKYSKHKDVKGVGYAQYVNYDAIEVPYTDAIPSDFAGVMGVPISFLDKYCPDQFEIIGTSPQLAHPIVNYVESDAEYEKGGPACYLKVGEKKYRRLYDRIFIRFRNPQHQFYEPVAKQRDTRSARDSRAHSSNECARGSRALRFSAVSCM